MHRMFDAVFVVVLTGTLGVVSPLSAQTSTVRCTASTYGSTTSTRCSDGSRSTSEQIGSTVYTRDNQGNRSTLDQIGGTGSSRTSTYRDNAGTRGTLDVYGNSATYRDNRGTRMTGETYSDGSASWRVTSPTTVRGGTSSRTGRTTPALIRPPLIPPLK